MSCGLSLFCVFVFKQKTAYEMRISDWSSDVCSSDLAEFRPGRRDLLFPLRRGLLIEGLIMNLRLLDPVEHIVEHRRKQVDGDDLGQRLDLAFRHRIMRIGLNSQELIDRNRGGVAELLLGGGQRSIRSKEPRVGRECVRTCK